MTNDDGSQRRDTSPTDRSPAAEPAESAAAPVIRLLANPRRVRRT